MTGGVIDVHETRFAHTIPAVGVRSVEVAWPERIDESGIAQRTLEFEAHRFPKQHCPPARFGGDLFLENAAGTVRPYVRCGDRWSIILPLSERPATSWPPIARDPLS